MAQLPLDNKGTQSSLPRRGLNTKNASQPDLVDPLQPPPDADQYRQEVWEIRKMMRGLRWPIPDDLGGRISGIDWHSQSWEESEENLDDPGRIWHESDQFLNGRHKFDVKKMPTARELFALAQRSERLPAGQRLRVARLMARVPQSRVAKDGSFTKMMVSHWESNEKNISIASADILAKSVRVPVNFLLRGVGPAPSWLEPWIAAVTSLADVGSWMAASGYPPPATRSPPPGPFSHKNWPSHYVAITDPNDALSSSSKPVREPAHAKVMARPLIYAETFIIQLDMYLQKIGPSAEIQWRKNHSHITAYLPFLPYVWHQLGLLIYDGTWPSHPRLKTKKVKAVENETG